MPDILHRISIDASAERVHDLVASTDGVGQWWTGRPLEGETGIGDKFAALLRRFRPGRSSNAGRRPTARAEVTWRVVEGPESWVGTLITFAIRSDGPDSTTLLFTHSGWREASEFMSGCSTNWGAYLTSLKTGAESGQFAAFPLGEISRWG